MTVTFSTIGRRCWRFTPAAEQHGMDDGFKRRERVVHADYFGDKVEVDQEQNDSEVDERERCGEEEDSTHL